MKYPLMRNNITRQDIDVLIVYLQQDEPTLNKGPHVEAFEQAWSEWLGVKYSVFINSGAAANLMSMALLKLKYPEGGEVIVPSLTWVSDIASVIQNGFTPVFSDVNAQTLSLDTAQTLDKITDLTRAVFITHAQGFNGLTGELLEGLNKKNILLIEDACQAHGAMHQEKKVGTFGWLSNFSFYTGHHMSTIEGGMVCTNDYETYQQAKMMRGHGLVRESSDKAFRHFYQLAEPELNPDLIFLFAGYNMRNTEIAGLIGCEQLKRIDGNIEKSTANLKRFLSQLDNTKYRTDFKVEGSSNHGFSLVLKESDKKQAEKLMQLMCDKEIAFRRGCVGGGNQLRQPYLKEIVSKEAYKNYPVTEHLHFFGFHLGNAPELKFEEIDEICTIVNGL